ncbi:MAG: hypothetical protein GXN92_01985, partial [Candidatus Micrarchaeota archaeon]|nr:hypothetical protein [Candidatus Micrarchaeota archaeon]
EVEFEVYIPPPETNNTIVIGSTVEDESSPPEPPVEENITPVEERVIEPEVPPQEEEPEIVEQPPEPQPTPAPPKEEKVAAAPVERSYVQVGIVEVTIPILALLLIAWRVAKIKILKLEDGRTRVIFLTLWNSPIKNKKVIIQGEEYRTDQSGSVILKGEVYKKDVKLPWYITI